MLEESKLYSFLDEKSSFMVYFLEAQKLIHDLILTHPLKPAGIGYFRNAALTVAPMISLLKRQEGMGIYIDSNEPYFRLKFELHSSGTIRSLLLPEGINIEDNTLSGQARLTKLIPGNPYTSIIELSNTVFEDIINEILTVSYQIQSRILLSDISDQSIQIAKLPISEIDQNQGNTTISFSEYELLKKKSFQEIFQKQTMDEKEIINHFEKNGLSYLGSKHIKFFCPCSRERMLRNIITLPHSDIEDIFKEEKTLDARCDYCKKEYKFVKSEIIPDQQSQ